MKHNVHYNQVHTLVFCYSLCLIKIDVAFQLIWIKCDTNGDMISTLNGQRFNHSPQLKFEIMCVDKILLSVSQKGLPTFCSPFTFGYHTDIRSFSGLFPCCIGLRPCVYTRNFYVGWCSGRKAWPLFTFQLFGCCICWKLWVWKILN